MLVASISDLHLGCRDAANLFAHSDDAFLRFLDHLEDNFERIVLLGDIWETLTSHRYLDAAAGLQRCRRAHPRLAERFERPPYHFILGNHDIVTGEVEDAPEELILEDGGTRYLFFHGHQSDPIVMHHRWLSELGVWTGGWLRRASLGTVYTYFDRFNRKRSGHHKTGDESRFERYAVELAAQRRADVVVTGHTHVATKVEHDRCLFLNGGSCATGFSYIAIDTRAGTHDIRTEW